MDILSVENLSHKYSVGTPFEKVALDNINLKIEAGSMVGMIGHTGCGKSTLIQHFNGLLKPSSGKIIFEGKNIWENKKTLRDIRFNVGLCFQYPEYQLFAETSYQDIAFGPKNMGLNEDKIHQRVMQSAKFVGVKEEHLNKSPFDLSGGEKRRVAIAGVLAMNPKLLILDEPTAGLDPRGRDKILGIIKEYHQEVGNTVLWVSHSMEDVAKFAQKVIVMNSSEIVMYDDVEKIFSNVDKLKEIKLDVPQITSIFSKLKSNGYDIKDNIFTVEQAKKEIMKFLARRQTND